MIRYLDVNTVLALHDLEIQKYGGKLGVLDRGLLEYLCVAPKQTFDSIDLYPTVLDKAAKYLVGFSTSQVFEDGNKRIAVACMLVFLMSNGYGLNCSNTQLTNLCLSVSNNQKDIKGVVKFLETHAQKIK